MLESPGELLGEKNIVFQVSFWTVKSEILGMRFRFWHKKKKSPSNSFVWPESRTTALDMRYKVLNSCSDWAMIHWSVLPSLVGRCIGEKERELFEYLLYVSTELLYVGTLFHLLFIVSQLFFLPQFYKGEPQLHSAIHSRSLNKGQNGDSRSIWVQSLPSVYHATLLSLIELI